MIRFATAMLASAAAWFGSVVAGHAATENILYTFCSQADCTDGTNPPAGLISVKGVFYGTATDSGSGGGGVVFSLDGRTGVETTLHSFQKNGADGYQPFAGLRQLNHVLYGTTAYGGANGYGTVYSFDPVTGVEAVLYSFQDDGADGSTPFAGLTIVKGMLYGTTEYGGAANAGTVFSVDPATGKESVVHAFSGIDGANPLAGLIAVSGRLYGTTYQGGSRDYGVLFSIDPAKGTETVLHSFGKNADGANPEADLMNVNKKIYGTTFAGGTAGSGTVFSMDLGTGREKAIYSFQNNGADGKQPAGGLLKFGPTLYGTTSKGGSGGEGTVFSLDPRSGTETVIHSFVEGQDGTVPAADLLDVKGVLYGTTVYGGQTNGGTIFDITP